MNHNILYKSTGRINQDFLFDLMLLILSSLHIICGLFPISQWIMLAGLAVFTLIRVNFKISVDKCILFWWAYTLYSCIGVVYTNDISYAIGYVLKIIALVLSLSFYYCEDNSKVLFRILRIVVLLWISTIILDSFFPTQIRVLRLMINPASEDRIDRMERAIQLLGTNYGIFTDPAVGAFFCACGLGIGIDYLVEKKKSLGLIWIIFSIIGIVLTNKRGPMLSVAVASSFVYLARSSATVKKKIGRAVSLIIAIAIVVFFFTHNQTLIDWYGRVNQNVYSNRHRMDLYTTLYNNFLDNPIFGSGTKSTRVILNGYDGHNIFLAALSENGILGLVLLLAGFSTSVYSTIVIMREFDSINNRRMSGIITFCLFSQIYIICYGMTGNPMTTIYTLAMFFMCLGIPLREQRLLKQGYFD